MSARSGKEHKKKAPDKGGGKGSLFRGRCLMIVGGEDRLGKTSMS